MNTTLDSFESALLTELRQHVVDAPAPEREPQRSPGRRPRRLRLAAVGATGVAASVVAVFGLGSTGGSPAYAVAQDGDGDVIVTVHRLDDASGLEKDLAAQGIDATVRYDADGLGTTYGVGSDGSVLPDLPPPDAPPAGTAPTEQGSDTRVEWNAEATAPGADAAPGGQPGDAGDPCGLGSEPATLTQDGSDWVLRIPAGSPLQDRHVAIGTGPDGSLSVFYEGDEPGSVCGMVSVTHP